jgi:transposase
MDRFFSTRRASVIVIEVGAHSGWVSRFLKGLGHEVIVANSRKLRMIYGSDTKRDKTDAEMLARVGRLLCPIRHRDEPCQMDLGVIRSRDILVRTRTKLINHVRGTAKAFGYRLARCSAESFCGKAWVYLPEELRSWLGPILETIGEVTDRIRGYDQKIDQMARQRYGETEQLMQVSGVGQLTALAYVLTLEDPDRFVRSRSVGAYLGLRPRVEQSGDTDRQLRITKAGDNLLRRLLVGSAHYVLGPFGPDCDLRRWGLRIAQRGGKNAKKRAVVAVARKLSVLLHRLWVSGEIYQPFGRQPV